MGILKERLDVFKDGARHCLSTDGFVVPVFALADKDGNVKITTAKFCGGDDKDRFADFMIETIREHGASEYLTVTESWVLRAPKAAVARAAQRKHGSLEHVPGREEAVVIVHCTPTTETFCMAKIDRSGPKPALGDWESSERKVPALGIAEGDCRFMGLFAKALGATN